MNVSPWHRDRDLPVHYDLMLSHAPHASVLLVPDGDGWALPRFTPEVPDFRTVRHITDYVKEQYGMESMVQRCVANCYDRSQGFQYKVYALENRSPALQPLNGGQWVRAEEVNRVHLAIPEHREVIRHWLQEMATGSAPELRAPWAQPGWLDDASAWIQDQLARLDLEVQGPMVQERSWALSCIMRIETGAGNIYFKAVPPFMTQETVVMRELSKHYPELTPPPRAIDAERGWILMPDFGGDSLLRTSDLSRLEAAAQIFARMQTEQVDHVEEWLARGVPDRRLHRMVQLIDPLIAISTQLLAGDPPGFSEAEVESLHALPMKMKLLCAKLASYDIPHTLVHGDLGGNILVNGGQYIFFDWTDACLSHPFFEMAVLIDTVFDESLIPRETDTRTRLRDAYLEPWTAFDTMERLVEAFELTKALGVLHQAMSYMWILMNVAEDARWELESGLLLWLRRLLPAQPVQSG